MDDAVPACAMLHFIVMDHDMIGRNDFAGEAFIRLEDVPGFAGPDSSSPTDSAGGQAALRQFNLLLMHADQTCTWGGGILDRHMGKQQLVADEHMVDVLRTRADDTDAHEFIRHIDSVRYI
jgi:hypothetical protein